MKGQASQKHALFHTKNVGYVRHVTIDRPNTIFYTGQMSTLLPLRVEKYTTIKIRLYRSSGEITFPLTFGELQGMFGEFCLW